MCNAARSGSEVNLEVALALLQPSIFPDVLQHGARAWGELRTFPDPGVAAIEAGHPQLLGWLLRRCPGLLGPARVLEAAARHCDLAGLQAAWAALRDGHPSRACSCVFDRPMAGQPVLNAAAGSATPDAVAKVEWVLGAGQWVGLKEGTVAAAAASGDLGRLRWLREQGCLVSNHWVLESALEHAELAVAQWLVDEAGCRLPAAAGNKWHWGSLVAACAKAPDGAAKLQWLREQGAPPLCAGQPQLHRVMTALAKGGHVEVLQYLLQQPGLRTERGLRELRKAAAQSGRIPMVQLLRQQAGCAFTPEVYCYAARSGSLAMVRWLADEAGVSPAVLTASELCELLCYWPCDTAAGRRDLLEAVQLLVAGGAGGRGWDAATALQLAAKRSHPALAQYLLQQTPGYRPGGPVLLAAAEAGCEALLEWLVGQQGCDTCTGDRSPYFQPARYGDLGTLTALRRLGVPWGAGNVVLKAVEERCGVDTLRWLVEQGAPVGPEDEVDRAVAWEVHEGHMAPQTATWLRSVTAAGQGLGPGGGA